VKDENGDLLADSHNILNRWKNSQLSNAHGVSGVRQIEPLVSDRSPLECEVAIAKLKKYEHKLPVSDQILAELIQAGGET
jgi:hypothetical protein